MREVLKPTTLARRDRGNNVVQGVYILLYLLLFRQKAPPGLINQLRKEI